MNASETLLYVVLGLGPGAVYAALGCGLVLTYRGSGIVNLAYGAMAMYPTYVYAELRRSGDLALPGIPGTHQLGDVGAVPALAIAVAVAALLGLVSYGVVGRPRRGASPLTGVVGAVGLLLTLQAVVALRFGTDPMAVGAILPAHTISIDDRSVPADRLYLVALVAVVLVASSVLYRATRFGLASRAATESPVAVELLGYSAVRLGATNWVVGTVLAALFGILLAPIAGLAPGSYSLLVVPALVAALAGRLRSTWIAAAAGLSLGLFQAQASRIRVPWDWLGPQTVKAVLPFVALVGVLMAVGMPLPSRGAVGAPRLPAAPSPRRPGRWAAALTTVGALAAVGLDGTYRSALAVTMIGALLCLSLVILTGYGGQVSLAQMSFAGIAGFVLSHASSTWGVPFPIAPILASLVAGLCGVVIGLPALRARGMTVAITTLGAALAVEELIFRNLSSGILATSTVPRASVAGVDLGATAEDGTPRSAFVLFVLAVLVVVALAVVRLRAGGLGRRMLAVRSDERSAAAAGVNVGRTKLVAFALSGGVAGLAGTLAGYHQGALSDQSFSISRSLVVLAVAYLGGIGTVAGALIGGLLIPGGLVPTVAERVLHLGPYETLLAGLAVIAATFRNPAGIASRIRGAGGA